MYIATVSNKLVSDCCDDDHGTEDEEQRSWINRRDGEASESHSGQVAARCSQSCK